MTEIPDCGLAPNTELFETIPRISSGVAADDEGVMRARGSAGDGSEAVNLPPAGDTNGRKIGSTGHHGDLLSV